MKTVAEAMILSLILVAPLAAAGTTETRGVEVAFDNITEDSDKWNAIGGVKASSGRLVMLEDYAIGSMEIKTAQLPVVDTGAGESGTSGEISAKGIVFKTDTYFTQSVTIRAIYGDKTIFGTIRIFKATRDATVTAEALLGFEGGGAAALVKKTVANVVLAESESSIPFNNLILEMEETTNTVKLSFVHGGAITHMQNSSEAATPWTVSEHKIDACRLELMGNSYTSSTPSAGTLEVSLEVNVP